MPRHPPIALTSRLRIHTTNDKIGARIVGVPGALHERPSQRRLKGARHSQLDNLV